MMNWRPVGILHPASPAVFFVPYVTQLATNEPKEIISCSVELNIPRRTWGQVSALYMGTTTMAMPVMPKVIMRPIVNMAELTAAICSTTPL
jgi:hypothetical protein